MGAHARLHKPQRDGKPLVDHHRQLAITLGLDPDEYVQQQYGATLPPIAGHLWSMFLDLSSTRAAGFSGPQAITFAEIDAFDRLHGYGLTPWDVGALRRMDYAWLKALHDGNVSGTPNQNRKPGGSRRR